MKPLKEVTTTEAFWERAATAVRKARFIKLTLGKSRHQGQPKLSNIYVRPVQLKNKVQLQLTFSYADHDEVKNLPPDKAFSFLAEQLGADFLSADLFTLDEQCSAVLSRKGKARFHSAPARHKEAAMVAHNRPKDRLIAEDRPYLIALGISDSSGQVTPSGQKKYKQINKFVEIVDSLLQSSPLEDGASIVDMGSGKGYLTFALHDHLTNSLGLKVHTTGVELRLALVEQCQQIAQESQLAGLQFVEGYIDSYQNQAIDLLIALHACDTATDDALMQGIRAKAQLMIAAPCCQKQVRLAMRPPESLQPLLRHGILLERQASMLTDALRALYLESAGYQTKVFEFISLEHTAKNVMITATQASPRAAALQEAQALKQQFGILRHRLEELLAEG